MCLVAVALDAHPLFRLIIASNRDEFHARPSAALSEWSDCPGVVGGRDLESGGGWFAADKRHRFALVTNVRSVPVREGRSRGGLVASYFEADQSAQSYLQGISAHAMVFRAFNLLAGDVHGLCFLHSEGGRPVALSRGIHALSNADLDTPWPKTIALSAALHQFCASESRDLGLLWSELADQAVAPDEHLPQTGVSRDLERLLSPAFIAGDQYGTRASTLLTIDRSGQTQMLERRFGPYGTPIGSTALRWPAGHTA